MNRAKVLILPIAAGAALLAAVLAWVLRPAAVPAQAAPEQSYTRYYSSNPPSSQESAGVLQSSPGEALYPLSPSPSPAPEGYVVREHQGQLAIFPQGGDTPLRTAEIDFAQLPQDDRALLARGIRVETLAQARQLLEDYQ